MRYVPVDEIDSRVEAAPAAIRHALRRWLWLVVLVAVAVGALTFAVSSLASVRYSAKSRMVLSTEGRFDAFTGANSPDPQRFIQTEADVIVSSAVLDPVRAQLGLARNAGLSVKADPELGSDLIVVTATADSATDATRLADAVTAAYVKRRTAEVTDQTALAVGQTGGDANRLADIRTRAAAYGDGLGNVEPATASGSTSGAAKRNALLGALAGLVLGCAAAGFAEYQSNRRGRAARRLQAVLGVPLLGLLPGTGTKSSDGILSLDPGGETDKAAEVLSRATVLAARRAGAASVLVAPIDGNASALRAALNIAVRGALRHELFLLLLPGQFASAAGALRRRLAGVPALAVDLIADGPGAGNKPAAGSAPTGNDDVPYMTVLATNKSFDEASGFELLRRVDAVVLVCSVRADDRVAAGVREQLEMVGARVLGFVLEDKRRRRDKPATAKAPTSAPPTTTTTTATPTTDVGATPTGSAAPALRPASNQPTGAAAYSPDPASGGQFRP